MSSAFLSPTLHKQKYFVICYRNVELFCNMKFAYKPDGSAGRDQVRLRKSNAGTCVFLFSRPCQAWHIKCSCPYVSSCIFAVFDKISLVVFFLCRILFLHSFKSLCFSQHLYVGDGPFEASLMDCDSFCSWCVCLSLATHLSFFPFLSDSFSP